MRRWLPRILLPLVFGAVTTVAVAWGFAFTYHGHSQVASGRTGSLESGWYVQVYERPGFVVLSATPLSDVKRLAERETPDYSNFYVHRLADDEALGLNWRQRILLGDSTELPSQGEDARPGRRIVSTSGWPWVALSSVTSNTEETYRARAPIHDSGIALSEFAEWSIFEIVVLPLDFELDGFIADTLFYAGLGSGVVFLIIRLRRIKLSRRSVACIAFVLLTLGVTTNVGVAWRSEFYIGLHDELTWWTAREGRHFSQWTYDVSKGFGGVRIDSHWSVQTGEPKEPSASVTRYKVALRQYKGSETADIEGLEEEVPAWAQRAIPGPAMGDDHGREFVFDGRGWPMLSLAGGFRYRDNGVRQWDFEGNRISPFIRTDEITGIYGCFIPRGRYFDELWSVSRARIIPLTPIWPGFLINTLFHTGLWLLFTLMFVVTPKGLRGAVRRRRGRCPTCGYDLRGYTPDGELYQHRRCTECGWARTAPQHHLGT